MDERERRIGVNEALFREVNERIGAVAETREPEGLIEILCECGARDCLAHAAVSTDEYERIRADAQLFVILPGHEAPFVERVVEEHERYVVVRKEEGEPARLAERTDPRS